jgi:hypothetical protein
MAITLWRLVTLQLCLRRTPTHNPALITLAIHQSIMKGLSSVKSPPEVKATLIEKTGPTRNHNPLLECTRILVVMQVLATMESKLGAQHR